MGCEMTFHKRRTAWQHAVIAAVLSLCGGRAAIHADEIPDFVRDIQPILQQHCHACHAGEAAESGLRLDIRSEAFRGGDGHGPAIIPGDAAASPLVRFVRSDEPDEVMPPPDADVPPLTTEGKALIAAWVAAGAEWPEGVDTAVLADRRDHWAFRRVQTPAVPQVQATAEAPRSDRRLCARQARG